LLLFGKGCHLVLKINIHLRDAGIAVHLPSARECLRRFYLDLSKVLNFIGYHCVAVEVVSGIYFILACFVINFKSASDRAA